MTLEGWNKLMYNYYNASNPYFMSLYMTSVVMIGSFFLLNLMLAAIWTSFEKVKEKELENEANRQKKLQSFQQKQIEID